MTFQNRVKAVLESLDIEAPEIKFFDEYGENIVALVVSPSFDKMTAGERQNMVWGKLLKDLGDDDSRAVEFVFTKSPSEVAEAKVAS